MQFFGIINQLFFEKDTSIMRPAAVAVVLAMLFGQPMYGQTPEIQIDASTGAFIVQTVIKRAKENDLVKKEKLTFKRVYTVHYLNDNGQVIDPDKPEKEEAVAIERDGKERMTEKKKNGKPVNPVNVSAPKFDLIKALEAVGKLDKFEVSRIEMFEGRPNYVISFEPKPGQRTNGDVEEVIVRSEGMMYVDIEKFYIKKFSAWMVRPYSRGGIFGWNIFNLTQANIEMAQEEFNDIVVMSSVVITDKFSVFGVDTFEKQTYTYSDYRQIEPR